MISLRELKEIKFRDKAKETKSEKEIVIENIPIEFIRPNPYQPRKTFSEQALSELSQSIKQYGLLQPINVRRMSHDYYELIAGERRLRASKMAGLTHIPAIIIDVYEQDSALIALIENLQREDLFYMEEAEGYYNLIKDHGFTQDELAKKLGKSQSTIANKLRLLKLSQNVKDLLIEGSLTERHARALLRLHDEDAQIKVIQQVMKRNLNVKKTEDLVEQVIQKINNKKNNISKNHSKVRIIYRDFRLFINTMKNAVKAMKESGISAQFIQEDKGDNIEIRVIIPKG